MQQHTWLLFSLLLPIKQTAHLAKHSKLRENSGGKRERVATTPYEVEWRIGCNSLKTSFSLYHVIAFNRLHVQLMVFEKLNTKGNGMKYAMLFNHLPKLIL